MNSTFTQIFLLARSKSTDHRGLVRIILDPIAELWMIHYGAASRSGSQFISNNS